jgi:hypothetical protein
MRITVKIQPKEKMRYNTVGDYFMERNGHGEISALHFEIADTGNDFYNRMILIHEMIEELICESRGISEGSIDSFDMKFEAERKEGNTLEPGDEQNAPYRNCHCFSTGVERSLCAMLEIPWKEYENCVANL